MFLGMTACTINTTIVAVIGAAQLGLLLLLLLQGHVIQILRHIRLPDVTMLEGLEDPLGNVLLIVVVGKLLFGGLLVLLHCGVRVELLSHRPLLLHDSLEIIEECPGRSLLDRRCVLFEQAARVRVSDRTGGKPATLLLLLLLLWLG